MTSTPNVERAIVRCQMRCPHGDQCRLAAGHENYVFNADVPAETLAKNGWKHEPIGCSHQGCFCNEPNKWQKPSWEVYFMAMARVASLRGTCDRLRVGAVIVRDNQLLASGYNGAPAGWPDCSEVGHQMSKMGDRESCVRTIHAEENAILQCAIHGISAKGAHIYTTASPCYDCFKRIAQAGITRVYYVLSYDSGRMHGVSLPELVTQTGIAMIQLTEA